MRGENEDWLLLLLLLLVGTLHKATEVASAFPGPCHAPSPIFQNFKQTLALFKLKSVRGSQ